MTQIYTLYCQENIHRQFKIVGSDVLKELATMRKQLQNERKRVENALENQKVCSLF